MKIVVGEVGGAAGAVSILGATNYAQYSKYLNEIITSGADAVNGKFDFFTWGVSHEGWGAEDLIPPDYDTLRNTINYEGQEAINLIAGLPAGLGLGLALASKNNKILAVPAGLVYGTALYNALVGKGMELAQESTKSLFGGGLGTTSAGPITVELILTLCLLAVAPVLGYFASKLYGKYRQTKDVVDLVTGTGP